MSNEERRNDPTNPLSELDASKPVTIDDASVPSQRPEERLARDLNEMAEDMTTRLGDWQDELTPPETPGDAMPDEKLESQLPDTSPGDLPPPSATEAPAPSGSDTAPAASTLRDGERGTARSPASNFTPEGTDNDRLLSALAWLSMVILQLPIVSVIQLFSATNRDRTFQRHHAVTSLLFYAAAIVYEIVAAIAFTILTIVTAGCGALCLWVIFLVPHGLGLIYAYQAYMGKHVELPVLSDFARRQGWI